MVDKMVFKRPKPSRTSPTIRLTPDVQSRVYEIAEQTGLTPNEIVRQILDYIGDNYEVD